MNILYIYTTCLYEIVQNIFFRNFELQGEKQYQLFLLSSAKIFNRNFELQGEKHSNSNAITRIFNAGIRNLCKYIALVNKYKWYKVIAQLIRAFSTIEFVIYVIIMD